MIISCNWLGRHVKLTSADLDRIANLLTLRVAELEGVVKASVGPEILVGLVAEAAPLAGTSLTRCVVDAGSRRFSVVCGAPNVAAGQRIAFAPPGAEVGGKRIGKRTLHGTESEGMICSEQELGIGPDQDGILVLDGEPEIGKPLRDEAVPDDVLLEIDNKSLTHRPDLWGHRGIAREVAALLGGRLEPLSSQVDFTQAKPYEVRIEAPAACARYCCVAFGGVRVERSPLWMRLLLHRVGVRPLNNVVDLTNFVMLDLGQPLHAFDRRKLAGSRISVAFAKPGESMQLLDGTSRELSASDLVIRDEKEPIALAGVMGGLASAIEPDTTDVLLESASFDPGCVRLTSQRLGVRTDASARFEKALDTYQPETAARAFARLLRELVPSARVESSLLESGAPRPAPRRIQLRLDRLRRRLGVDVGAETAIGYLRALEFGVTPSGDGVLDVEVPPFRATKDVTEEVDLIEEVGRYHGFENIPPAPPLIALGKPDPQPRMHFDRAVRSYLTQSARLTEILTYSFASEPFLKRIGAVAAERCLLKNPISDEMPALRTELATNAIAAFDRNAQHLDRFGVFEIGRVFSPGPELPRQPTRLALLLADRALKNDPDAELFHRLKAVVLGLSGVLQRPAWSLRAPAELPSWVHPVRSAALESNGAVLGYVGELHPRVRLELQQSAAVVLAELDLDALFEAPREARLPSPPPKHPAVFRDFTFLVPEAVRVGDLLDAIRLASERVESVEFRSVYRGSGIPEGTKTASYAVTLRHPERTLTDAEVLVVEEAIVERVARETGGTRR